MIVATQPRCLVLTPFSPEAWPVWDSIRLVLQEQGVDPFVYQHQGTFQVTRDFDLIIADVTGGNPNVMFELGVAMASGKPILPIVNRMQGSVPHSLAGYLFLIYDTAQPGDLQFQQQLKWWVGQRVRVGRGA
jgi:hypothetical protein